MIQLRDIVAYLQSLAPLQLAEEWDNVGLLAGDPDRPVDCVLTCLTLTHDVADEAIKLGAQLVVSHHPLPFKPVLRLTIDDPYGSVLWKLAGAGVAVYSGHTAYDSATGGINEQLSDRLRLRNSAPLRALPAETVGAGRYGELEPPQTLAQFAAAVRQALALDYVQIVGSDDAMLRKAAVACGAGASFLPDAVAAGCDVLVTGECRFHDALAARSAGLALVLTGHYASERFAMDALAEKLQAAFPAIRAAGSEVESDPLRLSRA